MDGSDIDKGVCLEIPVGGEAVDLGLGSRFSGRSGCFVNASKLGSSSNRRSEVNMKEITATVTAIVRPMWITGPT